MFRVPEKKQSCRSRPRPVRSAVAPSPERTANRGRNLFSKLLVRLQKPSPGSYLSRWGCSPSELRMAPARPFWKGYLKLSLVSCDVPRDGYAVLVTVGGGGDASAGVDVARPPCATTWSPAERLAPHPVAWAKAGSSTPVRLGHCPAAEHGAALASS